MRHLVYDMRSISVDQAERGAYPGGGYLCSRLLLKATMKAMRSGREIEGLEV